MVHQRVLGATHRGSNEFHQLVYLVRQYLADLGSARALTVDLLLRSYIEGDLAALTEIVNLRCDPLNYCDSSSFKRDYAATEVIRKFRAFPDSELDPEGTALRGFFDSEALCSRTNRRIRSGATSSLLDQNLDRAARFIKWVLGDVRDLTSEIWRQGAWGKGVTSSCKGKWLTEFHKMDASPDCTLSFLHLAPALWREATMGLDHREMCVVQGSKVTFVPKNAKTHRSIAIEPSVNLFAQRAVGKHMARRIRLKTGMDLTSQTRNQDLARRGSIDGSLATLDLSAASDTISMGIVERLFPSEWIALMDACRSKFTEVDGKQHLFHKWSSMGNGYTFEMETLIFTSLVRAVISDSDWYSDNWAVYGDDIIVPCSSSEELCELLEYCGFRLNMEKSFVSGPFRESCGADFYDGVSVRPFYLKDFTDVSLETWANRLYSDGLKCRKTWDLIIWKLGPSYPRIPVELGMGGIFTEGVLPLSWMSPVVIRRGLVGRLCRVREWIADSVDSKRVDGAAAVVANLRTLLARGPWEDRRQLIIDADSALSEPWRLTARKSGKWVTKIRLVV
uniref:RNA-directed RNA polymerase n=1 Tax=Hubei levi-like virus 10 TaxID=1922909 RepID=A0A1L3KIR0_9VIRU|nr:hypothetical protein [Hubei levi-like virus 10]